MRGSRAILGLVPAAVACLTAFGCELLIDTSRLDTGDGGGPGGGPDGNFTPDGPRDGPGNDAGDGTGDEPLDAACPGNAGPPMVRVGVFCIDTSEVTNADYESFLSSNPSTAGQPAECGWKTNYDHDGTWAPIFGSTWPAGNVDWCDAYAFCKFAGKRLCGAPGGGPAPFESWADASADEWFFACTGPDASAYPYGNTFNDTACNGLLADGGYPDGASTYMVEPVESRATCQGGYPGLYDMSGNVAEWEDSCGTSDGGDAAADPCRHRGGSAHSDFPHLRCDAPSSFGGPLYIRSERTDDLGFRCCSP